MFGMWLKQRRKSLDLTQQELADQVGCSLAMLRKLESNQRRPSKPMVERLAELLLIPSHEQAAFLTAARRAGVIETAHNLPIQPTSFVGRTTDLRQIAQHLANSPCRLLTILAPGGMGKTRLALQAAEQQLNN